MAGGQQSLLSIIGGQRLPQKMVHAVDQHHKEGQRRLDWEGTPASWLPDSEEPHLPGPDAQEAKGDGASSHSKPPKKGG